MSRFEEVIQDIKDRRQRAIDGKYNCLPLPFIRFRNIFPGLEQERYLLITANQKVGKSKFCDYWFIYEPLFFIMEHPELKIKVLYFTLEVNAKAKYTEFLCHLLYRLDNIIIDTSSLRTTDREHPVPEEFIELIESERYRPYIEAYEKMVTYIDDIKRPTAIFSFCKQYAESHGHWTFKKGKKQDNFGNWVDSEIRDKYISDDEEEYRVIILDNASNLSIEKGAEKKMETIDRMSKYFIELRNSYRFIPCLIQHQAQAQEGNENIKLNRTYPTADGLADCKTTIRDINIGIGLFNPAKQHIPKFENYDITKFGDHIRFMIVMEDRDYGAGNKICPLFFDGASSVFFELPPATNTEELSQVYEYIKKLDSLKFSDANGNKSYTLLSFSHKLTKYIARSKFKQYLYRVFSHFKHLKHA